MTPVRPDDDTAAAERLFDQLADGYDRAALRFFPFAADRLARRLAPRPGEKILDVATGTGAVAIAVGQRLTGGGRVLAIDISERMLDRAYANIRRMALHNVDLHRMDASALEFRDGYFDALTCSCGLCLLPDMAAALREWRRVLRPGGRLLVATFGPTAFAPLAVWFCEQLREAGGPVLDPTRDFPWHRLAAAERMEELLAAAGFLATETGTEQFGYHLQSPNDWWDIVWHTGFRAALAGLDGAALARFRDDHLARIAAQITGDGLWMDVPVRFTAAHVPE